MYKYRSTYIKGPKKEVVPTQEVDVEKTSPKTYRHKHVQSIFQNYFYKKQIKRDIKYKHQVTYFVASSQ